MVLCSALLSVVLVVVVFLSNQWLFLENIIRSQNKDQLSHANLSVPHLAGVKIWSCCYLIIDRQDIM